MGFEKAAILVRSNGSQDRCGRRVEQGARERAAVGTSVEHAQARIQIRMRADQGKASFGAGSLAEMNGVASSDTQRLSPGARQTLNEAAIAAEIDR
jgi:hypothetical protein